jgi:hypothetical protein
VAFVASSHVYVNVASNKTNWSARAAFGSKSRRAPAATLVRLAREVTVTRKRARADFKCGDLLRVML